MIDIPILNRRLAESLGRVLGLSRGKYEWRNTVDCHYYFRSPTAKHAGRVCWADRLGRGYVLCVWKLPEVFNTETGETHVLTEAEWKQMFYGLFPYPSGGEYQALPETLCREVTEELNQNYIWAIDRQMQQSYEDQLERIMLEKVMERAEWKQNFEDATFDAMPAFMTSESELQG